MCTLGSCCLKIAVALLSDPIHVYITLSKHRGASSLMVLVLLQSVLSVKYIYSGLHMCELVGSVNEPQSHHRVLPGQLNDAQIPAPRPLTHV